jgi:hypothetical protein
MRQARARHNGQFATDNQDRLIFRHSGVQCSAYRNRMNVAPNSSCSRREWRMRIGVVVFVVFTCLVAVVKGDLLWMLWGLIGLVPFAMVSRLPADVRQRLARHFSP